MENNNINSCLMLAAGLYTPVNLSSVFDSVDLKDTGIELESHITLLYARGVTIPRENILEDIETILGPVIYDNEMEFLESGSKFKVFDIFELSSFENDSDYIVLKLKKDVDIYKNLGLINKGLRRKYEVPSEYSYTPHLTLAELNPGTAKKYLGDKRLKLILERSLVSFEDFIISYGPSNVVEDKEKYNLTTFHAVDRYFREQELKRNSNIDEE